MVISLMSVGQKITAAIMNQLIGAVNQTALAGIIPTSVAGTGVTVSPSGAITLTNASTVSLNGIFSGTYDNYRITWNSPTRSVSTSISMHLRQAGVDLTSATYDFIRGVDSGTSRVVDSSSSSTGIPLDKTVAAGQSSNGVLDLFGPALTSATTGNIQSMILAGSTAYSCQIGIANESTNSSDGITFYPTGGGTWSGVIRVYGYNSLT